MGNQRNTGMTRPVDEIGRVVIPKEIRDSLDIREKDRMEFWISGGGIIMRKIGGRCCLCGAEHGDRIEVEGMQFCFACAGKIAQRAKNV